MAHSRMLACTQAVRKPEGLEFPEPGSLWWDRSILQLTHGGGDFQRLHAFLAKLQVGQGHRWAKVAYVAGMHSYAIVDGCTNM